MSNDISRVTKYMAEAEWLEQECRKLKVELDAARVEASLLRTRLAELEATRERYQTLYGRAFIEARELMAEDAYAMFVEAMDRHRALKPHLAAPENENP